MVPILLFTVKACLCDAQVRVVHFKVKYQTQATPRKVNIKDFPEWLQIRWTLKLLCKTWTPTSCRDSFGEKEMGKERKNTTWPQAGKMTDVELKCHDVEPNMAVRIVYKEDLKRSPFNWVVNNGKKHEVFPPTSGGSWAISRHFQAIYVAACKGQKQKAGTAKMPPTFP